MPIRVLHIVAHMGRGALQADLRLLLPRLQTADVFAGVVALRRSPAAEGNSQFPVIDAGLAGVTDVPGFARLVRAIHGFGPDLVHTHGCAAEYWALLAALLAGVKKIVHTERNGENSSGGILPCLFCAFCEKVVAFLPEHARQIAQSCRMPHAKIAVIPKGVPVTPQFTPQERNAARARFGIPAGRLSVLVAQCNGIPQNPELALQALAALAPQERAGIVMTLAGMQAHESSLRQRCADLDIRESVRFIGEPGGVDALLAAADVFLLTAFFKEMPVALIKAMLAGVAIVSTPWLGSSTMLGNGMYGFITAGWDAGDVAPELVRALRNAGARAALVDRAYTHARAEYDIELVAQAHRRLYRQMCSAGLQ